MLFRSTDEYEYEHDQYAEVEPEKETHIYDFNLDDERAEYLTTYRQYIRLADDSTNRILVQ